MKNPVIAMITGFCFFSLIGNFWSLGTTEHENG